MTLPHKTTIPIILLGLILLSGVSAGYAEEFRNTLSLQGFTGLLNTPNAEVADEGTASLLFSNQIESQWRDRVKREESYIFTIGIFSFAEIGGRLTEAPGKMRDLSANFKVRVPLIPRDTYFPQLAFGMQDLGGSGSGKASHLQTKYAVATKELGRFRLSLGYGTGPDLMDGVFGGVELKAFDWLYLIGEDDTREKNIGIRLVSPDLFGMPMNLQATAKTSLDHRTGHLEYGIGLQIPLGLDDRKKERSEEAERQSNGVPHLARSDGGVFQNSREAEVESGAGGLRTLQERLLAEGFQNVRVGADDEQVLLVVEYENTRYSHNELDGLGVVAGLAAKTVSPAFEMIQLVLKRKEIALVQIVFPLQEYREFLKDPGTLPKLNAALEVSSDVKIDEAVHFIAGDVNPTWLNSELIVYPGLKTFVGTEVGVFDYLLSIKPDYYLNLWKGAVLNARWDIPVAWSENFNAGKAYRNSRDEGKLERVMLFQTIKLAPGVMLNVGAGQVLKDTPGTINELMWTPGNGNHRFSLKHAYLTSSDIKAAYQGNRAYLASYRYYFGSLDLYLKGTAGQFLDMDRGFTAELKRFFGDTAISLYYKDTRTKERTWMPSEHYQVAGIQLSIPLTPRREMKPVAKVQVKGSNDWSYAQETRVGASQNNVGTSTGLDPVMGYNLERVYYNRDRLSEDYLRRHLRFN